MATEDADRNSGAASDGWDVRQSEARRALREVYTKGLLDDTVPFWFPRAVDETCGGFFTSFDRDGSLLQTDKSIWFQGRFAWMLATLYTTVGKRPEWLAWAKNGLDFLDAHGFDADGRMFFSVTREGRPLRKRRYIFSEAFAAIAYAAYARASGDAAYARRSEALLKRMLELLETPGLLPPKTDPDVRPMKALAVPMILLATAQEVRAASDDVSFCNRLIDRCVDEIERDFFKPEFRCVLETVGPHGEVIETFEGRQVTPGHSIEVGWFVLEEARRRGNDPRLTKLALAIIDHSYTLGWDQAYGGLLYHCDARGLPCTDYHHDMKFWWVHNEAIIATLLAYRVTGDPKYAAWHRQVHTWAYAHFPDPEYGEWYGYLHRDGSVSTRLKGNLWKGFFHLPRMQWMCGRILDEMEKSDG